MGANIKNKLYRFMGGGSEQHYQTHKAWREYPLGMQSSMAAGFCLGMGWLGLLFLIWSWM